MSTQWYLLAALLFTYVVALPTTAAGQNNVYLTTVSDYNNDVFELANGAVFERSGYGFVGFLGYRTEALLFSKGNAPHLWVDGKGLFRGTLLRSPQTRPNARAAVLFIVQVRGGGEFLELDSGELLEVSPIDTITTSLWFGPFKALLLSGGRLLRLDRSNTEIVRITAVR